MLRPTLAVVAEGVLQDRVTNQFSLFNIIENMAGSGFPLLIQRIGLFTLWVRDEGDPAQYQSVFTIHLDEAEVFRQEVMMDFGNVFRHRHTFRLGAIVVPRPGLLRFSVTAGGQQATYTIRIDPLADSTSGATGPTAPTAIAGATGPIGPTGPTTGGG